MLKNISISFNPSSVLSSVVCTFRLVRKLVADLPDVFLFIIWFTKKKNSSNYISRLFPLS